MKILEKTMKLSESKVTQPPKAKLRICNNVQLKKGKRSRATEGDASYDNFRVDKRYLTEVLASSLVSLSVAESPTSPTGGCDSLDRILKTHDSETGVTKCTLSPLNQRDHASGQSPVTIEKSLPFRLHLESEVPTHCIPSFRAGRVQRKLFTKAKPIRDNRKLTFGGVSSDSSCADLDGENLGLYSCIESPQFGDLRRSTLLRNLQMRVHSAVQEDS